MQRPLTMYSDDPTEYSPPKQPRVVVLPNKEQDIYTTTALRKAVATVTALGAASGLATTIQGNEQMSPEKLSQRRLIEATGGFDIIIVIYTTCRWGIVYMYPGSSVRNNIIVLSTKPHLCPKTPEHAKVYSLNFPHLISQ